MANLSAVGAFGGSFTAGSPIQKLQIGSSYFADDGDEYVPLTWTGGSAASVLKVAAALPTPFVTESYSNYSPASTGSFEFGPVCIPGPVYGDTGPVPVYQSCDNTNPLAGYSFTVDQEPNSAPGFTAQGITGAILANWIYRFQVNP